MPTNEERRRVADSLRILGILASNREVDKELVEDVLGLYMGEYGYDPVSVVLVANLIEPEQERTCTITHAVFNEGDPTGEYEAWNCSHCGELPYDDADSFSYCPCCGTKVAEQ